MECFLPAFFCYTVEVVNFWYSVMQLQLSPLTISQFLADYWQQRPVIIKKGLLNFSNPCQADELAGLATEKQIESRLIYKTLDSNPDQWQVESGPFEGYEQYGENNWTLVVQSVNHWLPAVQQFARLFDFIPQWRFDDVMVSFATLGGGVGPHVDRYDVFICQGSGRRRWRIGDRNRGDNPIVAHEKLLHVEPFDAIIDEVVSAGDIVYIPPGFPHEGISLDESMSFSVGYKSTNAVELLSGFADYLIDVEDRPALLNDSNRKISRYGCIDGDDFNRLSCFLQRTLSDENRLADFIGRYYSQSFSELDLAPDDYEFAEWLSLFSARPLHKLYAVKTLYLDKSINDGIFYVDGMRQHIDTSPGIIRKLCDAAVISMADVRDEPTVLHWLWEQTNQGYWYFLE
ncbi:MAG: cupin [Gammaproteobacteria bacterium]|nr:MAG: cupin [Gammaproteobacteria bacterium]